MIDLVERPNASGALRRQPEEGHFETHDGVPLFYRHWPAMRPRSEGAIVLVHRGHEHSGRLAHLVDELDLPGFAFFAFDARGHGRSPGPRGDSPGIAHSVRDIQSFVDHIGARHGLPETEIAVVAQSVGAVLTAAWAHDYAPKIRGMALAAPAFSVKLYLPFARQGLKLLRRIRGKFFVKSYVRGKYLSHDPERVASFESDPLISRAISVDVLLGLHETATRIVADAQAIQVPTQLLISGGDCVVHQEPQHEFFDALGTPVRERHVFEGFYHDTLGERDRAEVVHLIRSFILRQFRAPYRASLLDADRAGFSKAEADALAQPLPTLSIANLKWSLRRASIALASLLSRGVALGKSAGFDSGSMLDYVYRNEAAGIGVLGRAIDRAYLDSIGWRGIRRRKAHIEELIALAARRLTVSGRPLRLLDIAAGHGRYALDAIAAAGLKPESVLLRDYEQRNVEAGRHLIAERNLGKIARFEPGDAFDRESLATITPKPTLAIVSGLYELFPENAPLQRSLEGLAAAVEPGGYLLYTNQPWHPQLEYIARVLTSHRAGKPWVMRRRSQAEMDQLVEAAGFRKLTQRIDPWGIFTVSLAQRVA
ncbi:MAG TPA: bifunctional alpha/beta hydrolase/class I SAM-dependent methyltransferase [Candidatus Cybelea sp.]|nr:bifunctional alpha/beta hydrolase/class I SAM-dependent methyltransferase [Candidatus Cybelea sp.]